MRITMRFNKSAVALSALFMLLLLTLSCAKETPKTITILHTNDIHGHFMAEPASWLDDHPLVGGFVALDYYVKQQRGLATNSLLLDAGDFMTGNPICDMEYKGAYGGAMIEMMNMIGYDCGTIGNHEFDKSAANVRKLIALADYPIVCSNLIDSSGQNFTKEKYHIFDVDGLRVGVIGVTYHQMVGMAKPSNLDGFYTIDPSIPVNEIVKEIDDQTDLIIVLSHIGVDQDSILATKIKNVDVIVGGHSHTRIKEPKRVNGVLIVQAGSHTSDLGRLDLTVVGDSVSAYSGYLITTFNDEVKPDPQLAEFADSFAVIIEGEYGKVIGQLKTDWKTASRSECNVGDWLTDAMRKRTGADVAFINSGGIRKNIMAGPITLKDIAEMLPFQNYVETFDCPGADLLTIVQENARAQGLGTHGILQVSGLSYTWRKQGNDVTVEKVMVGGKPLDENKTYKIASIDYVDGNSDLYYKITPVDVNDTGLLLSDVIIDAVKKAGTIDSKIEGRIKQAQ
jgi:5'-nucleotidase/UDP-sugar diphosphatase